MPADPAQASTPPSPQSHPTNGDPRFCMLVALEVRDPEGYRRYRGAMRPILERYGGAFRYDFTVDELLAAPPGVTANRVFVLTFPSREASEGFFSDPAYLEVRRAHFDPSVSATHRLGTFSG